MNTNDINQDLFDFITEAPTAFHTVDAITRRFDADGFTALDETKHWDITNGGKYYVTRGSSSVIAFKIGTKPQSMHIIASHSDSPCFKVKPNGEIEVRDKYVKLNTEGYGGMICYSWLDRPLSIAGRAIVSDQTEDGQSVLCERLFNIDRDLCIIPSLAIHMNRKVNSGVEFNMQTDMLPIMSQVSEQIGDLDELIATELGIEADAIYGRDAFVYNRMNGTVLGADDEFIASPRLDDLQCAYASLMGFLEGANDNTISIYACFDNEEVGSSTLQGAASSMLQDTLERIVDGLKIGREDYHRMLAKSLMLSEDNGHAVHPNHPEKTDSDNCVYMNEGIVIKTHAGQKYTTDAVGIAICRDICEREAIPYQFYANRSDEPGGSTLGNLASCRVPVKTIDIGLAQLAMHSSYETAGADDTDYMRQFSKAFYENLGVH